MDNFLLFAKAFVSGGALCVLGQVLIDRTKLTLARMLKAFVVAGVIRGHRPADRIRQSPGPRRPDGRCGKGRSRRVYRRLYGRSRRHCRRGLFRVPVRADFPFRRKISGRVFFFFPQCVQNCFPRSFRRFFLVYFFQTHILWIGEKHESGRSSVQHLLHL